jgi:hypothetical protein
MWYKDIVFYIDFNHLGNKVDYFGHAGMHRAQIQSPGLFLIGVGVGIAIGSVPSMLRKPKFTLMAGAKDNSKEQHIRDYSVLYLDFKWNTSIFQMHDDQANSISLFELAYCLSSGG